MMAGGVETKLLGYHKEGKITPLLIFSCLVAASGGVLTSYEHGVSGGVTSMDSFLKKFFPDVDVDHTAGGKISNYCRFNSQKFTLFNSSLHFASLFSCLFASHATSKFGRRFSMRLGGSLAFFGAVLGGAAINLHMLILSRVFLGFGFGFTSQSITLYLSEMAPARYRGAIFNIYAIIRTSTILIANLVNYGSHNIEGGWGWRVSLGLAVLPATFLAGGVVFIPETPASIIQRGGDINEASRILQRIRGTADVGKELDHLIEAATNAPSSKSSALFPLRRIFRRKYRPQLVMVLLLPIFQKLAGNNLVGFYSPVMFRTIGLSESSSLLSVVVMKLTAIVSHLVAMVTVDKIGRRKFFFIGGFQLFILLVAAGSILATQLGDQGVMRSDYAQLILVIFCLFVLGFSWSWGSLPTLVTNEILPLEIRSAGRSIDVAMGFFSTSVMAQIMLFMLCYMKWGLFFFFGGWILLITLFVFFFLPETKGLQLEEMEEVWEEHWYWKRFVEEEGRMVNGA